MTTWKLVNVLVGRGCCAAPTSGNEKTIAVMGQIAHLVWCSSQVGTLAMQRRLHRIATYSRIIRCIVMTRMGRIQENITITLSPYPALTSTST